MIIFYFFYRPLNAWIKNFFLLTAYFLSLLTLCPALAITTAPLPYPQRPVRLIVGLGAGGGQDTIARLLAAELSETLKVSFVVDNRPSAGGVIACDMVANAAPDGYTLLAIATTHIVTPILHPKTSFNPLKDFSPIILSVYSPYVLSVSGSSPIKSVKALISLAKTRSLTYASGGNGGSNHLTAELFNHMANIHMLHVPYKSGALANSALMSGEVDLTFTGMGGLSSYLQSGKLRALAVTSTKRSVASPHIPTLSESGVAGFEVIGWYGLAAPANTAHSIVEKLNSSANQALPKLKDRYEAIGTEVAGGSAESFSQYLRKEFEKWSRVVKLSGIKEF